MPSKSRNTGAAAFADIRQVRQGAPFAAVERLVTTGDPGASTMAHKWAAWCSVASESATTQNIPTTAGAPIF
jgi:hypothetical protein